VEAVIGLEILWNHFAGQAFSWKGFDCAIMAAWWYDRCTGSKHLEFVQGLDYHDGRSALRQVLTLGGIRAAVSARIGPPLPHGFLEPGDLALIKCGHGRSVELLGVIAPQQVLIVAPDMGLMALPLQEAIVEGWKCRQR
jgi:hypothetical protein